MSTNWKPGDVAVSISHGYRSIFVADCGTHNRSECWHNQSGYSDGIDSPRRPLVVIDPEDREQVERLAQALRDGDRNLSTTSAPALQAALREFANPTPPKPDEPTGLGAVVRCKSGDLFTRTDRGSEPGLVRWVDEDGTWHEWDDLNVVEVLSEGVQS